MANDHSIEVPSQTLNEIIDCKVDTQRGQARGEIHTYPNFVKNLFKLMVDARSSVHHAATGLAGEAGEVLDLSKKSWAYGKDLDVEKLIEELGDMRFYYQAMLNMLNLTDEDIQACNIAKLSMRYPEGVYTDKHAIARLDKQGE